MMPNYSNQTMRLVQQVQRQLLLLDHPEHVSHKLWPRRPGLSEHKSIRLFEILERLGWITGYSLFDNWGYFYTLTKLGRQIISDILDGKSLMQNNELKFNKEDLAILANDVKNSVFEKDSIILTNSVFIVHGDDLHEANPFAFEVKQFIDTLGMEGQILDAKPGDILLNAVMDQIKNCGAAVCIWDADREKPETGIIRPNVLLETGIALGHLGQDRVFVIKRKESLETPSDLGGVVWMNNKDWQDKLPCALLKVMPSAVSI